MPRSNISTKILTIIVGVATLGMAALTGVFAYILSNDYREQYDTNLVHYIEESSRRFESDAKAYGAAISHLADAIEDELALSAESNYWNKAKKSEFIAQRRLLDPHSSVFTPNSVAIDDHLLAEVGQTESPWRDIARSFDPSMMSVSFISARGYIRTQPSHRAAFFPNDYDPRKSALFQETAEHKRPFDIDIEIDPLNKIYILSLARKVMVDDEFRGVVAGVFELSFDFLFGQDSEVDTFQPQLLIVDDQSRLLANPFKARNATNGDRLQRELDRLLAGEVLPNAVLGEVVEWQVAGAQYRVTSVPLKSQGWQMLAFYPQNYLTRRISRIEETLIFLIVGGSLALISVTYLSLRGYVVRPLNALSKATRKISDNHWQYEAPVLDDNEIGELSEVIDTLATELRSILDTHDKTIISLDNMSNSLSTMYSTLDAADNMTAILDAEWRIIYGNEQFLEVFSPQSLNQLFEEHYCKAFDDLPPGYFSKIQNALRSEGLWTNEIRILDAENVPRSYLEKVFCHHKPDGELVSIIFNAQALFQSAENTKEIERLAYYDHLTGLQNRTFFKGFMEEELASLNRSENMLALLYVDLDNFKMINDSMGHEAGDLLLIEVANRLKECLRSEDAVARLGGDEFAVLLKDVDALHYVSIVANKIIQSLNNPMHLSGQMVPIKASIGVTIAPDDSDNVMELMKNADLAMYQAKDKGKNNFRFYTQDMNRQVSRRMELEREVKRALDNHEFLLYYQPKVHLATGKIFSAEALVRWRLPNGEIRGPLDFIPAAEDSGLIIELGMWILKTACQQAKTLYKAMRQEILISVNVSARQLTDPEFVRRVEKVLNEVGIKSSLVELEITESLFMNNLEQTIEHLDALRELGVRISIDDFGTGYSSLSYLKRLPIDQLKVDRSFIKDLPDDEDDRVITELIVSMSKQLSLEVVAEGVETEEQYRYLDSLGCEFVQGYYFSRPLPPDQFMVFIFENAQKPRGVFS